VLVRDWYEIERCDITAEGRCGRCGTAIAGRFEQFNGQFGRRRVPVRVSVGT
jgi:pyruvate formate lyase activating enzyme